VKALAGIAALVVCTFTCQQVSAQGKDAEPADLFGMFAEFPSRFEVVEPRKATVD
jgi:hypothetical protein